MSQGYLYGITVQVSDTDKAAQWLCDNLFFSVERGGEEPILANNGFRLILRGGGSDRAKEYDPDAMGLGLRHIALETCDIQKAIEYCSEKGMNLQLGEDGKARHSGKVYGTGMDYFNIITELGFNIEVSQKLHEKAEKEGTIICGLEHIGLQTEDAYETIRFYESLGFRKKFEPVVNHADGHRVICCMMSFGGSTLEIYEFDDLADVKKVQPDVLKSMALVTRGGVETEVQELCGTAGETVLIYPNFPHLQ